MFKCLFRSVWFGKQPYTQLIAAALLMASSLSAVAGTAVSKVASPSSLSSQPTMQVPDAASDMTTEPSVQIDPLDSPHPIPWNWVMATHTEVTANGGSGVRYYRSPSLVSPDGQYAAYSRIQMQVQPDLFQSRVSSVMFLENLKTGDLRTVSASSPLADNPFISNEDGDMPGAIAIMIPVSWSAKGDRILARQFEGMFSTSDASDYAVVWDRQLNRVSTIAPNRSEYSIAVLLGWSKTDPDRVLFKAGELGEEQWPLWAVDMKGQTVAAVEDQPMVFGQLVTNYWAGPQAHY